jgi:cytochrome oxidase Cu insertion factor (SCO1/SenC/PrrC family)
VKTDPDLPRVEVPTVDRVAALEKGAPGVPRRVVVIGVIIAAVLALGGTALERIFSSVGLNPTPTSSTTAGSRPKALPVLRSSMAAFLGIVKLSAAPAPALALTDQDGLPVTLDQFRGKVIVLTFFDADCADACPVLANDLAQADGDLGADRTRVEFITVNADPLQTVTDPLPTAVASTGLPALGNWRFLGGSLAALDAVWQSYGVSINVSGPARIVAHNNVMYFIDPTGRLRIRATPVADESARGVFSLAASSVSRSAAGVASYAAGLLPASP